MTRYPKAGKGNKWTIRELRAIPADWKGDDLSDGGGLVGEVRAVGESVSVAFRYGFKWQGKKAWFYCGTYPAVELAEIRARRDAAREQVAAGVNPNDKKAADRIERQKAVEATIEQARQDAIQNKTVADLFDLWIVDGVNRKDGNEELRRMFVKDILPAVGTVRVRDLTEAKLRDMLRSATNAGTIRKAQKMLLGVKQMLRWAEKRQPWRTLLIAGNPADLIPESAVTPADYEGERDRTLSKNEIRELAAIFQRTEDEWRNAPNRRTATRPVAKTTQVALWLCLSTLCRIGELLMARWEHIDLAQGVWFIPRENVKGRRGKKREHYVFLSDFARAQFEVLRHLTGESEWCFPAKTRKGEHTHVHLQSVSKQVGDRQVRFKSRSGPFKGRAYDNTLVLAGGANGEWTPHDLRRTGATMMQALGVSIDVIDRCQNHVLAGKVRRVYLRHDYEAEKREAWRRLGEELEAILLPRSNRPN